MSEFLKKLAEKIISDDGYKKTSNTLFESYLLEITNSCEKLKRNDIKKLLSSAQIFFGSGSKELMDEGATILSMMLDIFAKDYPDILPIANSLFANAGDFPNIRLLNERHPDLNFRYNFYYEAQIEFRRTLNSVAELDFPLTDFQRSLWNDLSSDQDIITSAPTSAGKTHIILHYLLSKVAKSDGSFAAVVVPTRALISEVSGKIYELAKSCNYEDDIEICTVPKDGDFGEKTFFVMTQERLHEILLRGDITFDYLFIDEAHNIADKSRGVLLHLTIEKMLENSLPQVIISTPSHYYQNSFSTIFKGIEFKKAITKKTPVAKIMMSVEPKGRDLVISRNGSTNKKKIPKGFNGRSLADIVYKLGTGQSNIIYRNKTNYCESFANDIANLVTDVKENPRLEEAANYVEEFVHDKFSLAGNLRKGVAFHYGPLPSSIRVMVENLVKDDQIKFIACTSTLAEGVNLPAKNLFLKNPLQPVMHQPSERLENVKMNNVTGRAGRMLQHFSGNIFLIEPETWTFKDYFDGESEEGEKIPTYFKSLNDELELIVNALKGTVSHDEKDQYRLYIIANKLIKEYANGQLDNTLLADELTLNAKDRALLQRNVKAAYDKLKVAAFTLEANPTVGYIQQNKLFSFIAQLGPLESWVLPHPKSPDLYETLLKICYRLNQFGVYIPSENYTLEYICIITRKWVQGHSLRDIISEQIEWDSQYAKKHSKKSGSVNSSVRNVIKVINNDIRFRLSNALRCYQVLLNNVLVKRGIDISNVKLHAFIEVGACDDRMISLINMGLSREAAKEIDDKLSGGEKINSAHDLLTLNHEGKLSNIHSITRKELLELLS
jgi:replicative superfamily II helicase